ncbi:D-alanine--D-alanine ligase, partial [Myxococcota bacterium]|nr:D-alanine--D-alanine ligase [Myxococcota bacterium]
VLKNDQPHRVQVQAPADLPSEVIARLRALTATVMRELDVRDLGRADFRVTDEGEIYFIEVNALPSLEPGASLYQAAKLEGLSEDSDVLAAILESAIRRQRVRPNAPHQTRPLRVGFAYNIRRVDPRSGNDEDAEFDSPRTIEAIGQAIARLGHEVIPLEATPDLPRLLSDLDLDLVFNIAEGLRGRSREAQIPALLELLDIPYTGSDAAALAVTLDKGLAKRLVREAGVLTPRWALIAPGQPSPTDLRFPVIVKPNAEGSSKGISQTSVARDAAELAEALDALHQRYHAAGLVEEFLPGREFTVGILGDEAPQTLPIMEVRFHAEAASLPIYSYEHKTEADLSVSFDVPARIDDALAERLRAVALASFEALGCRDVGRVDLRLDADGEPNFIECNPLPGLSPGFSDLCVAAEAAGLDHAALIAAIMAPAVRRLHQARAGGR